MTDSNAEKQDKKIQGKVVWTDSRTMQKWKYQAKNVRAGNNAKV